MADTQRTLAAILALLADNSTRDISAQDLRDAIVSVFANYGIIGVAGGVTAQTGITATPAKVTGFTTDGLAAGAVSVDAANDRLQVTVDGIYLVFWSASFSGTPSKTFLGEIYAGGATVAFKKLRALLDAAGGVADGLAFGVASLTANDYIEARISSTDGGTSFTLEESGLLAVKVG